jgi:(p)ppGpp synthase/HD superfamily hydrolase
MIFSPKIQKAIQLSIKTHEVDRKQKRKGKDVPYITHPLIVGLILSAARASEDVIVAGILHDTIEDSASEKKVDHKLIGDQFGPRVANLVLSVTEQRKDLPWDERKSEALQHIKHFSHDSLLLKSADTIANLVEIWDDYLRDGDATFKRFNAPKEKLVQNYTGVIKAILNKWPESPLANDLKGLLRKLSSITRQPVSHDH